VHHVGSFVWSIVSAFCWSNL